MSAYFLVEGQRTEKKIYSSWLTALLPGFSQVQNPDEAGIRNYYVIAGMGYPSLFNRLISSVEDCNSTDAYNYLVVCLDADEASVQERREEVLDFAASECPPLRRGQIRVVVQNRTIETWLLGNTRAFPVGSVDTKLRAFLDHHDVRGRDPESMRKKAGYKRHAALHYEYLRSVFSCAGAAYTKTNPGRATEIAYLDGIAARCDLYATHLSTFRYFYSLCKEISRTT